MTIPKKSFIKYCMFGFFSYASDARVRGYAELLLKAGNMVDVLGVHGSTTDNTVAKSGLRVFTIPVSRTRKSRIRYLLQYSYTFLLLSIRVTKLYLQNRYDIIHVHNMPDFLVFCALIPKLLGAKIILDVHDPMPEVYLSKYPGHKRRFAVRFLRLEEKISARFADAVITANAHFRDNLIRRGLPAAKITTINNHPDPQVFDRSKCLLSQKKQIDRYTLIFPGTLAPRYGLEVAIRAMPYLIEKIPNIRLLIFGRQDDYAKSLISLAAQLGISQFVDIKPSIPITEVPQQLVQADVGIYPALPDCHMSIAIPGKMLEFAMMGLPIVSSRLQIVEETFGDSAVLFFQPGNSEDFAHCVLNLHDHPALHEELVQQADRILAERHAQEREVRAYEELLSHLLPERRKVLSPLEKML